MRNGEDGMVDKPRRLQTVDDVSMVGLTPQLKWSGTMSKNDQTVFANLRGKYTSSSVNTILAYI